MNTISEALLTRANIAAIFNLYLYLSDLSTPIVGDSFRQVIFRLLDEFDGAGGHILTERESYKLRVLKRAVEFSGHLSAARLITFIRSAGGLAACAFKTLDSKVYIAFRGTSSGEWLDNGEGLSGIPEENTYFTYNENGIAVSRRTMYEDYATDSQVEALNWFNRLAASGSWGNDTYITVSGHSKGGNKAQFIALQSDFVDECFSFDGQGFSPEAVSMLINRAGDNFYIRKNKIYSFSADNDYVSVLGNSIVPPEQTYYLESERGLHHLEAILDHNGNFRPLCPQGLLSRYMESVSERLMSLDPFFRKYVTVGLTSIIHKKLGNETLDYSNPFFVEEAIAGIGIALSLLIKSIPGEFS